MTKTTRTRRLLALSPILLAWLSPGCVTLEKDKPASPDTPVSLYAGALSLEGATLDQLRTIAPRTAATGPMELRSVEVAAAIARPAVVSIYFEAEQKARVRLLPVAIPGLGIPVSLPGSGLGSGFIVHEDGYVITNAHVVRHAKNIRIVTYDGIDLGVEVVAVDPVYDLALLRIVGVSGPFPVLPIGDSNQANVGSWAVAVGNPLGLGHTVTLGIISQTGRHLSGVEPEEGREIDYIQMDTAINPGSSGGPLITLTGACVGVNTAGFTEANGISFAVPSSQVIEFLTDVTDGNGVQR